MASYPNLEPRLSARLGLGPTASLKASYNRMVQYIHLISNTTAATPLDVWLPSTRNMKPEHADQISLGYCRNFQNNAYEASVEVFGKQMDNQIDYIAGANTLLNTQLEAELLYGKGRAYGAELYVKKNQGRLTGWVSYTLSRSERQIDGLNNGNWYVNKYDKTPRAGGGGHLQRDRAAGAFLHVQLQHRGGDDHPRFALLCTRGWWCRTWPMMCGIITGCRLITGWTSRLRCSRRKTRGGAGRGAGCSACTMCMGGAMRMGFSSGRMRIGRWRRRRCGCRFLGRCCRVWLITLIFNN